MAGIRIKNLQAAAPLIGQSFDEMLFVVDLESPDTTLRMSGAELKAAVGIGRHTHELEDVDGLVGELEKKLNCAGGTVSGDLRVDATLSAKNVRIDEYLEVPELKYNRVTATDNELWATDAGVVNDVWRDDDGVFLVTLKATEGENTICFEYKDILRGIYFTDTGFQTVFFEVTGIIDQTRFDCIALNDIAPQRFMTLVRQGNKTNPSRQGSVYIDGLHKFLRVLDGVHDENITQQNIKVQLGDLSGINHPTFGQLSGFGALLENAYISGRLVQHNPDTGEEWAVGAVAVQGEQVFRYDGDGNPDKQSITLSAQEFGISSTPEDRQWQCKNGEEWVDIPDSNALSLIVRHDDALWAGRLTLTLRYIVQRVYFDIITLSKLYCGEDAITIQVLSSDGNNFINGEIETTLEAHVFRGSRDITQDIAPSLFSWVRISENTDSDNSWNLLHQGVGNTITINDEDVFRKAVFECQVTINPIL